MKGKLFIILFLLIICFTLVACSKKEIVEERTYKEAKLIYDRIENYLMENKHPPNLSAYYVDSTKKL